MKSGELARLTGVTVRTLRHYRTIGLLAEPTRDDNGYCNYTGDDYFRLLRIKNLSALGFSLSEIKEFLAHPETAPDANLDVLDARLVEEIERLESQRRTIALLKAAHAGADVPPIFADFLALLSRQDLPEDILQAEINGFLAAAHSLSEDALHEIVAFYKVLIQDGLLPQYCRLCLALYRSEDGLSETMRDNLAQDLAALLQAILGPIHIDASKPLFEDDVDFFGLSQVNVALVQDIYHRALQLLDK